MNDITGVSVSPDGRWAAFRVDGASVESNAYTTNWYVIDLLSLSLPQRLAAGGSPLRNADGVLLTVLPIWSPDSEWIYFRALHGAEIQIWRASIKGDQVEQITSDASNVQNFTLSGDGSKLIFSVGATRAEIVAAEESEYDSGILIDGSIPVGQGLFRSGFVEGRLASQRYRGEWMAREGLLASRPHDYKALDIATRKVAIASADDVADLEHANDGAVRNIQTGAVAIIQGEGENRLLEARSGESVVQCRDSWCAPDLVTGFAWRPGRNELIFSARDRSWGYGQKLMAWTPGQTVREIAATDGLMSGDRSGVRSTCAASAEYAVCVHSRPAVPPKLVRIDLDTGEMRTIFDPNPGLVECPSSKHLAQVWRGVNGERASSGVGF